MWQEEKMGAADFPDESEGSETPKMPCDACPELKGEGFYRRHRVLLQDESSKESHSKQCGKWYKDGLK